MACILNIETATKVCSVALSVGQEIVFNKEEYEGPSHAVLSGVFVNEALQYAKTQGLKLDAIAVSSGPGSYTGLRIGVSMAKGLCYALDVPLIAVPTLEVLASRAIYGNYDADYYCPMIDARRMEVYAALYDCNFQEIRPVAADIVEADTYAEYLLKGKVLFFGDGAAKCKDTVSSKNATFADNIHPLASEMVVKAQQYYEEKKYQDVAYFEPFYLKDFQATTPKKKI